MKSKQKKINKIPDLHERQILILVREDKGKINIETSVMGLTKLSVIGLLEIAKQDVLRELKNEK